MCMDKPEKRVVMCLERAVTSLAVAGNNIAAIDTGEYTRADAALDHLQRLVVEMRRRLAVRSGGSMPPQSSPSSASGAPAMVATLN